MFLCTLQKVFECLSTFNYNSFDTCEIIITIFLIGAILDIHKKEIQVLPIQCNAAVRLDVLKLPRTQSLIKIKKKCDFKYTIYC